MNSFLRNHRGIAAIILVSTVLVLVGGALAANRSQGLPAEIGPWRQFQAGPTHTGVSKIDIGALNSAMQLYDVDGDLGHDFPVSQMVLTAGEPMIDWRGEIVFGDGNGSLHIVGWEGTHSQLDMDKDGETNNFPIRTTAFVGFPLAADRVFVADDGGTVYATDTEPLVVLARFEMPDVSWKGPLAGHPNFPNPEGLDTEMVFVAGVDSNGDGILVALEYDPVLGSFIDEWWQYDGDGTPIGPVYSGATADKGQETVFIGSTDGYVYAVWTNTGLSPPPAGQHTKGTLRWKRYVGGPIWSTTVTAPGGGIQDGWGGVLFVNHLTSDDPPQYACTAIDIAGRSNPEHAAGTILWTKKFGDANGNVAHSSPALVIDDVSGVATLVYVQFGTSIYALDKDGNTTATYTAPITLSAPPHVIDYASPVIDPSNGSDSIWTILVDGRMVHWNPGTGVSTIIELVSNAGGHFDGGLVCGYRNNNSTKVFALAENGIVYEISEAIPPPPR